MTLLIKITEIKEQQIFLPFYIFVFYIESLFFTKNIGRKI